MRVGGAKWREWRWEQQIDEMFAGARDDRSWMSLFLEPEDAIGPLEEAWNAFDALGPDTKLLHNTGRLSQPWKTGLPIDFTKTVSGRQPRKWGVIPRPWIARVRTALSGSGSARRSEEHTSELQSLMRLSYAVFCLKQKTKH